MSPWNRALLSVLITAASAAAATTSACGPPTVTETSPSSGAPKTRAPDKTEVTMEVADPSSSGGASESSGTPTTTPPTASGSSGSSGASTPSANDPSDEPNIGGVQEGIVEMAVAPTRPRLRACYKKALAAEPGVSGSSTFDVTIGKEGKPATVRFVKRNGLNEDMVGCLLATIKAMTFGGTQKSQILTLSFGAQPPSTPPIAAADAGAKK